MITYNLALKLHMLQVLHAMFLIVKATETYEFSSKCVIARQCQQEEI